MQRNPVGKLLLFGATGDLAKRMLLPRYMACTPTACCPRI